MRYTNRHFTYLLTYLLTDSPITVTKQRVLRHYQQHHRGRRLRRLFCYEELSVSTQQNISRPGRFIDIRQRAIAVLCVLLVQRS